MGSEMCIRDRSCAAGERRRVALPGWARRPSTAWLRAVVVGSGASVDVSARRRRGGSVTVPVEGVRPGPIAVRLTGGVPGGGGARDYRLRRAEVSVRGC